MSLNPDILETLRGTLRGSLLTPEDEGYDDARQIWNARLNKRPGAIARCTDAADVQAAIDVAREQRVASAYGRNYQRLAEVKKKYDPGNLFRVNQNVPPAA